MSAVLPVRGERWRFRHLDPPRGMVDVRHVENGRVSFVYVSTGIEQETDLTWFLRAYHHVDLSAVSVDGSGS